LIHIHYWLVLLRNTIWITENLFWKSYKFFFWHMSHWVNLVHISHFHWMHHLSLINVVRHLLNRSKISHIHIRVFSIIWSLWNIVSWHFSFCWRRLILSKSCSVRTLSWVYLIFWFLWRLRLLLRILFLNFLFNKFLEKFSIFYSLEISCIC